MIPIRPPGGPAPISLPGASPTSPITAPAAPAAPSAATLTPAQSVIADLQAGRISPDEAVRHLTSIAIQGAGVPSSAQPAVETRIRATLAHDPLVGSLLQHMGATIPED